MGEQEAVRNVLEIRHVDDEHLTILVNGERVAHANHDEHGWDGIDAVKATALGIAESTDMKVVWS